MQHLLVPMSGQTLKDYWSARKAERKRAAEFYVDNPEVTVAVVMAKFHLSRHTVTKALAENGINIDHRRNPTYNGNTYKQRRCSHCHDVHWCGTKPAALEPEVSATNQAGKEASDDIPNAEQVITDVDTRRMLAEMSKPPRS